MSHFALWLETWSAFPGFYISIAVCLGLVVGSFLNVVIHRLPTMLEQALRNECCDLLRQQKLEEEAISISLSAPPSSCPQCQQRIQPWHNIPILSYLVLRGKCHYCEQPISARYPVIEAVTGALTGATLWLLGLSPASVIAILLLWTLIALAVIDIDTYYLPDNLTLPLLWCGLIANYYELYTSLASALWGAIMGYLSLWSIYWLFKLIAKKEGMGYGDFKLLAALGAWLGVDMLPIVILFSSFVGAVVGIGMMVILGRDKNVPIPFGPYLAIAGWITFLWGDSIVSMYLNYL